MTTENLFIGIDPSYNGFAIIVLNEKGEIVKQVLKKTNSKSEIEQRMLDLQDEYSFIGDMKETVHIYIEGLSYSSNGAFVSQLGALHYFLRIFFYTRNIPFKLATPNELKKFVTGKGQCKKDLMLLKVYKKWGIEFEDDNLADAYGLAQFALEEFKNGK